MGNNISKILKDHFLLFEEDMKNEILFCKGKVRSGIEICARGKKYTGVYSIKKYSKTFAPLQTGMWWKNLFFWRNELLQVDGGFSCIVR